MAAFASVTYLDIPDRTVRANWALGAVAFAYMDALSRSAWADTVGLLALYQELFNENRDAVLKGFADEAAASRQIPQALAIDGQFGPNTRTALVATLVSGFEFSPSVADTMPRMASGLGRWFIGTVRPRVMSVTAAGSWQDFYQDIARVASSAGMAQASTDVRGAILPWLLSGAASGSSSSAVDEAGARAWQLVEQSGSTQGVRAAEYGAGVDNPTGSASSIALPGMLLTAKRSAAFPDWGYYAAAAGILGLGGFLAYQSWRKKTGR